MRKLSFHQWRMAGKLLLLVALTVVSYSGKAQTKLGVPYATVAGHASGSRLPIATLKENTALSVSAKEDPSRQYYVVSYKMVMDHTNGNIESATCQSAAFSTQAKQYLNRYSEHGRVVSFEDIRVKDDKGKELKVPSIFYIID